MARDFNGSTMYGEYAGVPLSVVPLSISQWFNPDIATAAMTGITIGRNSASGSDRFGILYRGDVAGDPVHASVFQGVATTFNAATSSGFSTGSWQHALAVFSSNTARAIYLNGGSKGTDTNSCTPGSLGVTTLGHRFSGGARGAFMDGKLGETAVWNIALSDDDALALATGICPLMIHPEALVAYWPIYGLNSPESELIAKQEFTLTASPAQADHHRVWRPGPRLYSVPQAIAAQLRQFALVGVGR